jgi:hypothetical protein
MENLPSSIVFERTCKKLIEMNRTNKNLDFAEKLKHNEMIEKFINVMMKIKKENVPIDLLCIHFEIFINSLIEIEYLNQNIAEYLSTIGKYIIFLTADQNDTISSIITKLLKNFDYNNENFVLNLLDFLNQLNSIKNKVNVENMLKEIFEAKDFHIKTKWSIRNLPILVEKVFKLLDTYSIQNRSNIYTNIIVFFMKINTKTSTYFENKLSYIQTESQVIRILTNHLETNGEQNSNIILLEFIKSLNVSFFL